MTTPVENKAPVENHLIKALYGTREKMQQTKAYKECLKRRNRLVWLKEGIILGSEEDRRSLRWWNLVGKIIFHLTNPLMVKLMVKEIDDLIAKYDDVMDAIVGCRVAWVIELHDKFEVDRKRVIAVVESRYRSKGIIGG